MVRYLSLLTQLSVGLSHSHSSVRECESVVRATTKVNGEGQTLTPPPLNLLTDIHQNLRR